MTDHPTCASRADGSLLRIRANDGPHRFEGKRCLCHGHCRDCGRPAVMDKMGRFVHVATYRARRRAR